MAIKYVTRRAEDKKWCVKNAKADKVTRVFSTQKEAIDYAKSLKSTTSIMVQSREGKFRKISKSDGTKKASSTVNRNKKASRPTTNTTKKPIQVKPTEEEGVSKEAKLQAIEELKAQNAVLDAEIAKEKEVVEMELRAQEETKKSEEAEEAAKMEEDKASEESKLKGKKWMLAFGIIFFIVVLLVGILFVLDWKDTITFMDVIKK